MNLNSLGKRKHTHMSCMKSMNVRVWSCAEASVGSTSLSLEAQGITSGLSGEAEAHSCEEGGGELKVVIIHRQNRGWAIQNVKTLSGWQKGEALIHGDMKHKVLVDKTHVTPLKHKHALPILPVQERTSD